METWHATRNQTWKSMREKMVMCGSTSDLLSPEPPLPLPLPPPLPLP